MDIDITKLTSKGQVVIPKDMRIEQGLKKGDRLLVISSANKIIFEPVNKLRKKTFEEIREDIVDKKIADEFWKKEEQGNLKAQTKDEFLEELKKW